jgi:hypothetical protein
LEFSWIELLVPIHIILKQVAELRGNLYDTPPLVAWVRVLCMTFRVTRPAYS